MHVRSDDNIRQHLDALNGMRTALLGFDKPNQLRLSSITRIYFVFAFLASEPSLLSLRLDHGQRTTDSLKRRVCSWRQFCFGLASVAIIIRCEIPRSVPARRS